MSEGFADLGLEQPGSYELPSFGIPVGTHHGFIKVAEFVAKKDDPAKQNLHLVIEADEPGTPHVGDTVEKYSPANKTDTAKVKGYLVALMGDLGFPPSALKTLKAAELMGMPVYFTMYQPRDSQYTRLGRVVKDTDGQFRSTPQPAVQNTQVVSADNIGY